MKAVFIIALIACACASPTFLGNLQQNYEKARAQFDAQFIKMQKLQEQASDLQDLAAKGGVDPTGVSETITGLTDAAQFWGNFIGDEIFDKDELKRKISQLEEKSDQLEKYASEDGTAAMVALNQAIWDINVCLKQIQSLAKQLRGGAKNVQMITAIAFKNNEETLTGSSKLIYEGAIRTLLNTLNQANQNCAMILAKLDTLGSGLVKITTEMNQVSRRLKKSADGASQEFEEWRSDMRAKVYGGCAASVLLGPGGLVTCYGIAAAVLETEIADYKEEVEKFRKEFLAWSETFGALATMSSQAKKVCEDQITKVGNFKDEISIQLATLSGTESILYLAHGLRQMQVDNLQTLIAECDKIIADTTGKLKTSDEEELFQIPEKMLNKKAKKAKKSTGSVPETTEQPITSEDVEHQVETICRSVAGSNTKAFEKCVKATASKLMKM